MAEIPAMVRKVKDIGARNEVTIAVVGHAGDGNLHVTFLGDESNQEEMVRMEIAMEEVFLAALSLKGVLSGEHGIGKLKAKFLTPNMEYLMSLCLSCKACAQECPGGVLTDELVEAARAELVQQKGLGTIKSILFRFLMRHNWLFDTSLKLGSILQPLFLRPGPGGKGKLPRLPLGLDQRRLVQPLAGKFLKSELPPKIRTNKKFQGRVAFFTGCMINYVYPSFGIAVVKSLVANGFEVIIPSNQQCCGTPARVNGDLETARVLATANLKEFSKLEVDAVITACASCGLALKKEFAKILEEDHQLHPQALRLGDKVQDFSEFIMKLDNWQEGLGEVPIKVTYHDPCHLKRGQGIADFPRQLLKAVPGVELVEMQEADRCCGAAGSFSLYHYPLSQQINDRKSANIINTGADCLVSACGSCLMHIRDGLVRNNSSIHTLHLAEVLALSYEKGGKEVRDKPAPALTSLG
ncbi:MAG: (Fe-S)-binding protein [Clostridia bacterium]|nr:(Fe-S)-binding protein [Clostridia bacterium]